MKLIKIKKDTVTLVEYGKVNRVRLFFLGVLIWTEHHAIEAKVQHEEKYQRANISEMEDYLEWRQRLKMGNISDEDFINILNSRF